MDDENLVYLLDFAKDRLKSAENTSNHNRVVDYRLSSYTIVNFYNVVLLNAGKKLGSDVKEGHDINKKLFTISQELPELLDESDLIDKVLSIRNSISHSDISIPKKSKLKHVVSSAESFKGYIENLVKNKIKDVKKGKH